VGICADINHEAYFNTAASQGAELMLCPIGGSGRDWLADKETGDQTKQAEFHRNLHMKFLPARASGSRMYVFYANQAGRSGDSWYPGLALALDPLGKLVGEHRPTEGMIVTDISKKLLAEARAKPAKANGSSPKNSAGQLVAVVAVDAAGKERPSPPPSRPFRALPFQVKLDTVLEHDDNKFLWFHPRAVAVPELGQGGQPSVFMTLQKHLRTSDHYSGLSVMRTDDLGKSWSQPDPRPELDWVREGNVDIAVADVTPGWHSPSGKVIAVGAQVRYSAKGRQLEDIRRAHQTAYAVLDPKTGRWTRWRQLKMPGDKQFNFARSACAQFVVEDDGTVLLPFYMGESARVPWSVTVARFSFDGEQLHYQRHGTVLPLRTGRGYAEPSLVKFQNRYYLTIRSNSRAHVTSSNDGLKYGPTKSWTFDDGEQLGSYNTQQHWLAHRDGLFLTFTRRGAKNDHIMRHRAPLFIAQVDPVTLHVVRSTEKVLIPERGATLGNFGAVAINENESWVTVCEGIWGEAGRKRGATGALFVARVIWSERN
ncbi:MAG: nitrilase-related carbon-nitrogen hydrolase, partial [Planctomycetaceae bacterium]